MAHGARARENEVPGKEALGFRARRFDLHCAVHRWGLLDAALCRTSEHLESNSARVTQKSNFQRKCPCADTTYQARPPFGRRARPSRVAVPYGVPSPFRTEVDTCSCATCFQRANLSLAAVPAFGPYRLSFTSGGFRRNLRQWGTTRQACSIQGVARRPV